ncbi:MAG: VOC family protein [Acidimicrobiia bacterium]
MISHLSLGVRDLDRAGAFYDAALKPLGYVRVWTSDGALGYGVAGGNDRLAIKLRDGKTVVTSDPRFHLALQAPDRAAVDGFYTRALESGGRSAGAPGPRPQYSPTYYAAFVLDPDGHRIEAVHQ